MNKPDYTIFINDHLGWHPAQLKEVNFLTVKFENRGMRIRQPDKRQFIFLPVSLKRLRIFRTNNDNLRISIFKFLVVLTQLRHMPLAKWSHKSTVEDQ